jgi:hypothetical protein
VAEVERLPQQIPQVQTQSREELRALMLAGDGAAVQRQVQAYVDIGVTHLIFALRRPGFFEREGLQLFARAIMPCFRSTE